jgi:hypothetical protein
MLASLGVPGVSQRPLGVCKKIYRADFHAVLLKALDAGFGDVGSHHDKEVSTVDAFSAWVVYQLPGHDARCNKIVVVLEVFALVYSASHEQRIREPFLRVLRGVPSAFPLRDLVVGRLSAEQ